MKVSRNTKYGSCVLAALLFVVPSLVGRAQQAPATPTDGAAATGTAPAGRGAGRGQARVPLLSKDKLRFQPEEAETGGLVFGGRESEPGVYITRNLFRGKTATTPAGGSRPHYHD